MKTIVIFHIKINEESLFLCATLKIFPLRVANVDENLLSNIFCGLRYLEMFLAGKDV